jgi:type IV pilus assembly protein PilE
MTKKKVRGFSLIALMVAVAVMGIISMVAYPSYINYMIRSNRNVAKSDLMELQQNMERNYSVTNRYDQAPDGAAVTINKTSVIPFKVSSRTGTANYNITFSVAPTALAYTLSAAPTGMQLKDTQCAYLDFN